ncbi:hypothetical protein HDU88_004847 [Geranomyces variabilis]|nr:hypothetical protein HDU88_004847 [Geranomyces variabilis]
MPSPFSAAMATIRGATTTTTSPSASTSAPPSTSIPAKPAAAATPAASVGGPRDMPSHRTASYPKLSDEPLTNWFADSTLRSDADDVEDGRAAGGARKQSPGGACMRFLAGLNLESRKAYTILLGLVCLDFLISLAALFEAIYDTALPPALSSYLTITQTLHTSSPAFTAARILLFTTSLLLRIAFILETALRIHAQTPAHFFPSPTRTIDAVGVLLLLILHIALPAREALICNTLILARAPRILYLLIRTRESRAKERNARDASARKRQWDGEMARLLDKNRALQKSLVEQGNKMKVFTGEVDIMHAL